MRAPPSFSSSGQPGTVLTMVTDGSNHPSTSANQNTMVTTVTVGSQPPITLALQPIKTPQLVFCAKGMKSGYHVCHRGIWRITNACISILFTSHINSQWLKERLLDSGQNIQISSCAHSLMTRDISCNQKRQITIISMLNQADHCALYQSTKQATAWRSD